MKRIPLTQGQFAIVDDDDYGRLAVYKWYANWDQKLGKYYAVRNVTVSVGKQSQVRMHREIMGLQIGDSRKIDHAQGNTLDNRRFVYRKPNLRIANSLENSRNARKRKDNTSGYKGVDLHKGRWRARIRVDGRSIHLGYFATREDARVAYDNAARLYFGEFARCN